VPILCSGNEGRINVGGLKSMVDDSMGSVMSAVRQGSDIYGRRGSGNFVLFTFIL